jgi:hypothetical protein
MKQPSQNDNDLCTDEEHELDRSISSSAVDIRSSSSGHRQLQNFSYQSCWDDEQQRKPPSKPNTEISKNVFTDSADILLPAHHSSAAYSLADDSSDKQSIGSKRQHYLDSNDEHTDHHDEVLAKRRTFPLRRMGTTRTNDRNTSTNSAAELQGVGGTSSVSGMSYTTVNSSVGGASGFSMMSNGTNARTAGRSSQGHIMEESFHMNHPSFSMGASSSGQMNSLPNSSRMPFASSSSFPAGLMSAGRNRIMHSVPLPSLNPGANRTSPMNTGAQINAQELLISAHQHQQQQRQQILSYQTVPSNVMRIGTLYTPMMFGQQHDHQHGQQHQQLYCTNANSIPMIATRQVQYGTTLHAAYMNQYLNNPYNPGFAQTAGNSQTMHYFQEMHQVLPGSTNFAHCSTAYQQEVQGPPRAPAGGPDQIEPYSHREIMTLASDGDSVWLSTFLCFLREHCCEVFTATKKDVQERRKSKQINLNQVGIRCRFCAHQPHNRRIGRSSCYPTSVERIYQSVTMMIREHFPVCDEFPDDVRRRYTTLKKNTKKGEMESKTHWKRSARSLGMIDTPKGIYFDENIVQGRLDQQNEAGGSNHDIGDNNDSHFGKDDDAGGAT